MPHTEFDPEEVPKNQLNLDYDFNLFELTDLFWAYYRYHNEDCLVDFTTITNIDTTTGEVNTTNKSLPRYPSLRRIEASKLGARPYMGGKGIAAHMPNISLGYMKMLLQFLRLPYKAVFNNRDLVEVQINKRLFDETKLSNRKKEELRTQAANNPNLVSNKEVSDDVSDVFSKVMRLSTNMRKCFNAAASKVVQDGAVAFLHNDLSWDSEPISMVDLVTEPQATWDSNLWGPFFIIRKMTAQEVVHHIRNKTEFWNHEALRFALEDAYLGRGLLSSGHCFDNSSFAHRQTFGEGVDSAKTCGENFAVKSYYDEKSDRVMHLGSYYGNLLVVEGYYINKDGNVEKVIFFPTDDFRNVPQEKRDLIVAFNEGLTPKFNSIRELDLLQEIADLSKRDILFKRTFSDMDSISNVITVLPIDPTEESLERQRGFGHELFSPIEMVMRLDSSILNIAVLSGIPFYRDRQQGNDAQQLEDMEINFDGNMVNLGDRDFAEVPFIADLNSLLNVRTIILQHVTSKAFLGGLDGSETKELGRGGDLAKLRLVRDGIVHKHNIADFAQGLDEFYKKTFKAILKEGEDSEDVRISKVFFDQLNSLLGHDKDILKFEDEDIVQDTGLPYWMDIAASINGASHFGPAELHLYSEIKQIFGDGLDQRALQNLNRMGIKSLLGAQDAIDILGDPKDNIVVDQEQVYRAQEETAAILGSTDAGSISFVSIPILSDKDDHVIHLLQSHNPKAEEILERLQDVEVTPQTIQELSESQLETRVNLILKLAALSTHIGSHLEQLDRFGRKRADINALKEQTNSIMQSAEGLFNSLQINLRALEQKRAEQEARLQNLSPENQAEEQKQQMELLKVQSKRESDKEKLALANKIADQKDAQNRAQRLSKERDRLSQERFKEREQQLKAAEIQTDARVELEKLRQQREQAQAEARLNGRDKAES